MSIGNNNSEGNKKFNFPFQSKVLKGIQNIGDNTINIDGYLIAIDGVLDDILIELQAILAATGGGVVSTSNNTSTPLAKNTTWTGLAESCVKYASVIVACKTDQDGTLYVDFSTDGTNWDSTLTYKVVANRNEVHRIVVTREFFRIRFENTTSTDQTYFRLESLKGAQGTLTSPLNSLIQSDADTIVVRPLDFNLMVGEGLYENRGVTIKDGFNPDVDTASVPEDVWDESGVYTGFPSAAGAAEIFIAAGTVDTGTVFYAYMATDTDLDYSFGSIAINGPGTYPLGHNIWRCNFAYFVGSTPSATTFNTNKITIRLTATPTTIFCTIPVGYSQSFCGAYTVPYKSEIYLDRITGSLRGSTTGSADGVFYYKEYNGTPRYRFPFELNFGTLYFDDIDYLIRIPERVDIVPRIISASANNLIPKVSYRLLKVKL